MSISASNVLASQGHYSADITFSADADAIQGFAHGIQESGGGGPIDPGGVAQGQIPQYVTWVPASTASSLSKVLTGGFEVWVKGPLVMVRKRNVSAGSGDANPQIRIGVWLFKPDTGGSN